MNINGQQQQITAADLEQAIGQLVQAVDWSKPPESDTVSYGARHRANAQALNIVVMCARKAMEQATPVDQGNISTLPVPPSAEVAAQEAAQEEPAPAQE